jgi:hypothetical protein
LNRSLSVPSFWPKFYTDSKAFKQSLIIKGV